MNLVARALNGGGVVRINRLEGFECVILNAACVGRGIQACAAVLNGAKVNPEFVEWRVIGIWNCLL